jgi:hypothetical protein
LDSTQNIVTKKIVAKKIVTKIAPSLCCRARLDCCVALYCDADWLSLVAILGLRGTAAMYSFVLSGRVILLQA